MAVSVGYLSPISLDSPRPIDYFYLMNYPNVSELAKFRDMLWKELKGTYPDDLRLTLVEQFDRMLRGDCIELPRPAKTDSEQVASRVEVMFRQNGNQPSEVASLLNSLRSDGIALPQSDHAAKTSIAAVLTWRKDRFKQVKRRKRPSLWQLNEGSSDFKSSSI